MQHINFSLRPYQIEARKSVLEAKADGFNRVLYTMPTGTGKTHVFCALVDSLKQEGRPALVLCHREELIEQAKRSFEKVYEGLKIGVERASSVADQDCDVIIASIQTLAPARTARLQWLAELGPSVIIYDECHHAAADGSRRIIERFGVNEGRTFLVGCTATPTRLDNKRLVGEDGIFEKNVFPYSLMRAWLEHWVSPVRCFRVVTDTSLEGVSVTMGDFHRGLLSKRIDTETRNRKVLNHWKQIAQGRQTLVFCASVEHARHAAEYWQENGYSAEYAHGKMADEERAAAVERFKSGQTQLLFNVELFTEGFDYPELNCIIMLRPTKSLTLYTQMLGRGMRIPDGRRWNEKELILLDVTDNTVRHAPTLRNPVVDAPVLAGLPAGTDLQGHTMQEATELGMQVAERGKALKLSEMERTFCDIATKLREVPVFGKAKRQKPHVRNGQRFGRLVVNDEKAEDKGTAEKVACLCDCGNRNTVVLGRLISQSGSRSCGKCQTTNRIFVGAKFARWTVISITEKRDKAQRHYVEVRCNCPSHTVKKVELNSLVFGRSKSCGCLKKEKLSKYSTKHGQIKTELYPKWKNLSVRPEIWAKFDDFKEWAMATGYSQGMNLYRPDTNLPLSPDNYKWVQKKQNPIPKEVES